MPRASSAALNSADLLVDELAGRPALVDGRLGDVDRVLVGAGQEARVVAEHPVPARDRVGADHLVQGVQAGLVVGVRDRRWSGSSGVGRSWEGDGTSGRRRRRDWTPESPERLYLLLSGHVRTPAAGVLRRTGPGLMAGRQPPTPDDSEGDAAPREVIERDSSPSSHPSGPLRRTAATNRSNAAELDRVRRELRALKRRRSVRYALALSARSARLASLARRVGPGIRRRVRRIRRRMIDRLRQRDLRATAAAETALVATLREGLPAATVTGGPLVSIVILNRDGRDTPRALPGCPGHDGLPRRRGHRRRQRLDRRIARACRVVRPALPAPGHPQQRRTGRSPRRTARASRWRRAG